jgi:hypothetical protein
MIDDSAMCGRIERMTGYEFFSSVLFRNDAWKIWIFLYTHELLALLII